MCGILGIFESTLSPSELRKKLIECSLKLRHRGPDWSGYRIEGNHGIAHERLSIVDPESGSQPLTSNDENVILGVNGEIYNHKQLAASLDYQFKTHSDCEVIIPLYQTHGMQFLNLLRGMYAFILLDKRTNTYYAARDHLGIIPLYIGYATDGSVWIASELKALSGECERFEAFPPGTYFDSQTKSFHQWYNPSWKSYTVPTTPGSLALIRQTLEDAVISHMMSDVPWGVLLSGGLDSSLIASIAARHSNLSPAFPRIHSFSIGLVGSPDLAAAASVANYLGTYHHPFTFTLQEGLDAVREVIYHLETYDVTTIRASTPMFLMSRKIRSYGIKMVLSGEGSDELLGGYLYFHKAPNGEEFQHELVDKVTRLHLYDNLRANKSTAAWGVEARVPFLDVDVVDMFMNIDPNEKMVTPTRPIEKYILRAAFDDRENPYLPSEILWRQKEQFSDGVGYGWIDGLKEWAERDVSDESFASAADRFSYNTPATKEAYLYRCLFEERFQSDAATRSVPGGKSIACSTERALQWDEKFRNMADPSGRSVLGVHNQAADNSL